MIRSRMSALLAAVTVAAVLAVALPPASAGAATPATSPSARAYLGMAYDQARGEVVLFGGDDGNVPLGDTWEWDGTTWTKMAGTGPAARAYAAMAFDWIGGRIVLFGGDDYNNVRNDTWSWNGSAWTQLVPTMRPSPRGYHAMTTELNRGRVLLFGGDDWTNVLNDTWEWDGSNWLQQTPTNPAPPRSYTALAYDDGRARAVLFGGYDANYYSSGETWEWDGTTWTREHPPASPSARLYVGMAYDQARGEVVLFGGGGGIRYLRDTWTWDGTNWSGKPGCLAVSPRRRAMACDEARGESCCSAAQWQLGIGRHLDLGRDQLEHPAQGSSGALPELRSPRVSRPGGGQRVRRLRAGRALLLRLGGREDPVGDLHDRRQGNLIAQVTIPLTVTAGPQRINAVGELSGQRARKKFTVT